MVFLIFSSFCGLLRISELYIIFQNLTIFDQDCYYISGICYSWTKSSRQIILKLDTAWEKHQICYNPFKIHNRAYKCKFNGQQLAASKIGIITYLTKCPWRQIGCWNWKILQKWSIFSLMISEKHVASFKNIFKIVLVLITPGRVWKKFHRFYLQN